MDTSRYIILIKWCLLEFVSSCHAFEFLEKFGEWIGAIEKKELQIYYFNSTSQPLTKILPIVNSTSQDSCSSVNCLCSDEIANDFITGSCSDTVEYLFVTIVILLFLMLFLFIMYCSERKHNRMLIKEAVEEMYCRESAQEVKVSTKDCDLNSVKIDLHEEEEKAQESVVSKAENFDL
ncbi:CLUMA_CG013172, isoform A [Clunio marinus]|uniref:CLUMA_CG013172, isoform A n=1 Tax=Clunio marinus TaxID=568069 RepID=A0A1J1IHZ3_9DIPT|nr:CLUMA_CG013172, isoform A [Clunio marinus]